MNIFRCVATYFRKQKTLKKLAALPIGEFDKEKIVGILREALERLQCKYLQYENDYPHPQWLLKKMEDCLKCCGTGELRDRVLGIMVNAEESSFQDRLCQEFNDNICNYLDGRGFVSYTELHRRGDSCSTHNKLALADFQQLCLKVGVSV